MSADPGGRELLEDLGYTQKLNRRLSLWNNVGLTLSDITPMGSLLVIGTVVIANAGTGSVWSYVIGCFLAMLDYIGQAIFLPASIAIGVGTYLASLNADIATNWAAAAVMVLVTVLALLRIELNALLTATFLGLQLIVLAVLFLAGVIHLGQPLDIITDPVGPAGGGLGPVETSAIVAALATAMFSVNGYDSAINFSEETGGSAADVGKAVLIAASLGIAFELIPFLAAMFGTEDLRGFVNSETPLTDVIGDAFGGTVLDIVTVVAILAILNASLAITLQFARILWASGRDRAWPEPASGWLGKVSREGSPWVATIVVGGLATALCIESDLITVVTFTAVLIVTLYALIAISALASRVYQRDRPRPYRMPLWPVPPLIALAGVVVALTQQKARDLLIVGAIFAGGFVYYMLFVRPRGDRYWTIRT